MDKNTLLKGDPNFTIENNILKGKILPLTMSHKSFGYYMMEQMNKNANITALIDADTEEKYTFSQMKDLSVRCALWLLKCGVKQSDVVTLCTHNHINTTIPFFGTIFIGAICNPWYHKMNTKSTEYVMNLTKPKVIFCTKDCVHTIAEAAANMKMEIKIVTFEKVLDFEWFEDVINDQKADEVKSFQCVEIASLKQPALIMFSSGTTGMPKAVELSNESLMHGTNTFNSSNYSGKSFNLWYATMCWFTAIMSTFSSILKSSTTLIHRNFDVHEFCKVIEKYKISWILISTSQFHQIHKANVIPQYNLQSLRFLMTGGAKTSAEALDYFAEALPDALICQAFGMTETGGVATAPRIHYAKNKETVGTVARNTQIKFIDQDSGPSLGPNKVGEVCCKSLSMMTGYYENPEATKSTVDEEGWIHSGDLGYYDEEGYIYLVDRMKDILKVQEHHVSPWEIEKCLLEHPGILEVAVVGVPHNTDTDHPLAFVSKKSGSQVTEEDLINLAATLGDFKRLRAGVKFLDQLPHTSSDKIDRKALREMAKQMSS